MPDLLPTQPPKQSRSKRTLERIVRASLAILENEGPEGLTVQAIVGRSGSSVGSFYARFAGKDELLAYLGDRIGREAAERWDRALAEEAWDDLGLGERVEGAVRLLAEAGRSRGGVLRALEQAPGAREDAWRSFRTHVLRGLEGLLLERAGEMEHPEPSVAVRLGLLAVLAVLEEPAEDAAEAIPEERRREEAARLLRTYLMGGERRRPGPPDFFDVWA